MFPLEITIQGLPKTTNSLREHWTYRHKERKKWKFRVHLSLGEAGFYKAKPQPLMKAKLTLTRHSARACDFDGIVSSFKAVLDGLVECGVLVDDNMSVIGQPTYRWEKAPPSKGFLTVKVEEL